MEVGESILEAATRELEKGEAIAEVAPDSEINPCRLRHV
jgi:hypothetical protein